MHVGCVLGSSGPGEKGQMNYITLRHGLIVLGSGALGAKHGLNVFFCGAANTKSPGSSGCLRVVRLLMKDWNPNRFAVGKNKD